MASATEATIVPIQITVDGRTGVTLWAPPWEEDGEEWQAFLGSGDKLEIFQSTTDLAAYVARNADNDLVDHPSWDMVQTLPAKALTPEEDYAFDLDAVPGLIEGDPDEDTAGDLADICDMVQRIADCVDDGPMQHMLEGPVFDRLIDGEPEYEDEEWEELRETLNRSWPLLTRRFVGCLNWHAEGSAPVKAAGRVDPARPWEDAGILPLALRFEEGTGYTLRCYLDDAAIFLGSQLTIDVFRSPNGLIDFIRTAEKHDLSDLETWTGIRDNSVLDVSPAASERYDLRAPNATAREIAADISDYGKLIAVQEELEKDEPDWEQVITEIGTSLRWHD
ncbi:MAG TPA: hypothetical protein VHC49_16805 [Mycobacteriales bacterium]|nr:hypothetical protein [Mycobacteriales bacterium]